MANRADGSFDDEDFDNRRLTWVLSHDEACADSEKEFDSNTSISETNSISSPDSHGMDDTLCTKIQALSEDQIEEMVSQMKLSGEYSDSDKHDEEKLYQEQNQEKRQKKKVTKTQPKKVVKENVKSSKQLKAAKEVNAVESLPTDSTHPQDELTNSKQANKGKKEYSVVDYYVVPLTAKYDIEPTNVEKELTTENNKQKKTKKTQKGKQNKPNEINDEPKSDIVLSKSDNQCKIEDIENDPLANIEEIINPEQSKVIFNTKVQEKKASGKKQNQKGNLKENSDLQQKSVKPLKQATETAVEKKGKNIKVLTTEEINDNIGSKPTRITRAKASNALKEVNESVDKNIADIINNEGSKKVRPKRNKDPQEQTKHMESELDLQIPPEKPKKKLNSTKQKEPVESLSTLKTKAVSKINSVKAKKTVNEKENNDTKEEIVKKRVTRKK